MLNNEKQIIEWLKEMNIDNAIIMPDLTVNVEGNVMLKAKLGNMNELPIQFGIVTGNFDCSYNELNSLKGMPNEIQGNFDCSYNYLINLLDGPQIVKKNYLCSSNKLNSLLGAPQIIFQIFSCDENQLTSLQYCPIEIGHLSCRKNQIKNFEYAPKVLIVGIDFSNNQVTSLKGLPKKIETIHANNNPLQIDDWLELEITDNFHHSTVINSPIKEIKLFSEYYKSYGTLTVSSRIFKEKMDSLYYLEEKRQLEKTIDNNPISNKKIKL